MNSLQINEVDNEVLNDADQYLREHKILELFEVSTNDKQSFLRFSPYLACATQQAIWVALLSEPMTLNNFITTSLSFYSKMKPQMMTKSRF